MTGIFTKGENLERHTHRGNNHVKKMADWGDTSTRQEMPKIARKPPDAGREKQNQFSSQPQKELTFLTPWSWTSNLQNCKSINSVVQATEFVVLIRAALGNEYSTKIPAAKGPHCIICEWDLWIWRMSLLSWCSVIRQKEFCRYN